MPPGQSQHSLANRTSSVRAAPAHASPRPAKPKKQGPSAGRLFNVFYEVPASDDEADRTNRSGRGPETRPIPAAAGGRTVQLPSSRESQGPRGKHRSRPVLELPQRSVPSSGPGGIRHAASPPLPTPSSATPTDRMPRLRPTASTTLPGGAVAQPPGRTTEATRIVALGRPDAPTNGGKSRPAKRAAEGGHDRGAAKRARPGPDAAGGTEVRRRGLAAAGEIRTANEHSVPAQPPVRGRSVSSSPPTGHRTRYRAVNLAAVRRRRAPSGGRSGSKESDESSPSESEYGPAAPNPEVLSAETAAVKGGGGSSDESARDNGSAVEAPGRLGASPEIGDVRRDVRGEARRAVVRIKIERGESEGIQAAPRGGASGSRDVPGGDDLLDANEWPEILFTADGRLYRMVKGEPATHPRVRC